MHDGPQRLIGDRERQHVVSVVVHDGLHVLARRVDSRVNHALTVRRAAARIDRGAVERELHEVVDPDQSGAARARQPEALGVARVAHADVAERVDDAFIRENAIRGDEPLELRRRLACGLRTCRARHAAQQRQRRARLEHAPPRGY
jgi:hypothetical protein